MIANAVGMWLTSGPKYKWCFNAFKWGSLIGIVTGIIGIVIRAVPRIGFSINGIISAISFSVAGWIFLFRLLGIFD